MKTPVRLSLFSFLSTFILSACAGIPKGAVAVKPFDAERYLGKWYEIARFDFRFERNLNQTTAEYSLNADGSIKVLNQGFNYVTGKWSQAIGRAKFASNRTEGRLKVSFFGPFYAAYNVIALDPDYRYALVVGSNTNYMWILSREKTIPGSVKQNYVSMARNLGFDVTKLIWVEQK